jgi:hypothetical protein
VAAAVVQSESRELPNLKHPSLRFCENLVKVDFRGATSLATLSVDDCDDVTTIQVPPQLKQLVCSRLPRLCSLDLTAAPHMWALRHHPQPAVRWRVG